MYRCAAAEGDTPAPALTVPLQQLSGLRYGENPHQVSPLCLCATPHHLAALRFHCCYDQALPLPSAPAKTPSQVSQQAWGLRSIDQAEVAGRGSSCERRLYQSGCGAQAAAVYVDQSLEEVGRGGVATAVQHHGKEVLAYV